jgi:hypothetical protein
LPAPETKGRELPILGLDTMPTQEQHHNPDLTLARCPQEVDVFVEAEGDHCGTNTEYEKPTTERNQWPFPTGTQFLSISHDHELMQ